MATRGRVARIFFYFFKSILGHSGPIFFFFQLKNFSPKNFFWVCIRHFYDVFGPRAEAIGTCALKLSRLENRLITMNHNEFQFNRKYNMDTTGRFSQKMV